MPVHGEEFFDAAAFGEALERPGIDPRQWFSYGIVDDSSGDSKSVRFKDENGEALPFGVMVDVTLQPSGIKVPCRVAGQVAGVKEADWYPFQDRDEVLVAIPQGDERAGCVIIGRMNQGFDVFPQSVAGMDVTKNNFGFRRMRSPYAIETGAAFSIRSAKTGAGFTIDDKGQMFLTSGSSSSLVMSPDAIGLQTKDATSAIQIDTSTNEVNLLAKTTSFTVGGDSSKFQSGGTLSIATGGTAAGGHAITVEQAVNIVANVISFMAGPLSPCLPNPANVPFDSSKMLAALTSIISGTELPALAQAGAPGGNIAPYVVLIQAALAAQQPDLTGTQPGIGKPSLLI